MNPMQAISEGRKLSDDISSKMATAKLSPSVARIELVFAKRDDLGTIAGRVEFKTADPQATANDLIAAKENLLHVPIGFLIGIFARKEKMLIAHARPLVLDPAAVGLLNTLLDRLEKNNGR